MWFVWLIIGFLVLKFLVHLARKRLIISANRYQRAFEYLPHSIVSEAMPHQLRTLEQQRNFLLKVKDMLLSEHVPIPKTRAGMQVHAKVAFAAARCMERSGGSYNELASFAATVLQGITVTEGTDYFDSNPDLRSLANRSYLENGF